MTEHTHPADLTTTTADALLTTGEAAQRLGVDPATIRRLIAAEQLPAVRIGRSYRIEPDQLAAFTDQRRTSRPIVTRPNL